MNGNRMSKVELAVSSLGGISTATAYHSSVLLGEEEFSFSDAGISRARGTASHSCLGGSTGSFRKFDMGTTRCTGDHLQQTLSRYFMPGTYDLLKKNCNSFSDCALSFLVEKRLDSKYRSLERLGASAFNVVPTFNPMPYTPNPRAADFDLEAVILSLQSNSQPHGKGYISGGVQASSAEEMRFARVMRLSSSEVQRNMGAQPDVSICRQDFPAQTQTPSNHAHPPMSNTAGTDVHHTAMDQLPVSSTRDGDVQDAALTRENHSISEQELLDEQLARRLQAEEDQSYNAQRGYRAGQTPPVAEAANAVAQGLSGFISMLANSRPASQRFPISSNAAQPQYHQHQSQHPSQLDPQHQLHQHSQQPQHQQQHHQQQSPGTSGTAQPATTNTRSVHSNPTLDAIDGLMQEVGRVLAPAGPVLNEAFSQLNNALESLQGRPQSTDPSTLEARTALVTYNVVDASSGNTNPDSSAEQCAVCLERFVQNDRLRVLPCFHKFHQTCIDSWFARSCECPICKHNIRQGPVR